MTTDMRTTESGVLLAQLEDLWACLDDLFDSLTPDDWSRRHGKDWTVADVPYHLAYFDRDVVAAPIERGRDVPADEQRVMRTMADLNDWNARQFARRPAGQTYAQSLSEMREARTAVRRAAEGLTDADLERPAFIALVGGGWRTARMALESCLAHTWNHFTELRLRLKRAQHLPRPDVTHRALGFFAGFMPVGLNRSAAADTALTAVMAFTGPGGGEWTVRVERGECEVIEGRAEGADLVLTQSPETFVKAMAGMQNPMLALLTGRMKVRGFRRMGTFARLFPPREADRVIEPAPDLLAARP